MINTGESSPVPRSSWNCDLRVASPNGEGSILTPESVS
jgi:hypothetical protein